MPLPTPNLDDRHFQDIVDEAKRMIPRYSPQWTDHNVSDPGVTLIELFAWMVEMMLYRLNQVPEKNFITFMDLIGLHLEPPAAARTPLTFWLATTLDDAVRIPAGTEVATVQTASERAISFTTDADLVVPPPKLVACLTSPDEANFDDQFWTLDVPDQSFPAFSAVPHPGDAFYLGFREDHGNHVLSLLIDCSVQGIGVDPTNPPLIWETWSINGWAEAEIDRDEAGKPRDGTGGLNRKGSIVLFLPPDMARRDIGGKPAFWLRCRHTTVKPDQPTYSASPQIHALQPSTLGGTVGGKQARAIVGELMGRSDGMPGQSFRLEHPPILPRESHEVLEVQGEDGAWTAWEERAHFGDSRAGDRHFVLDSVSGEARFGPFIREPDGSGQQFGAIPPRGSQIRFRRYRTGGGADGNVEAGKLTVLKTTVPYVDRVSNRHRAVGGRDAESLEHAKLRAPGMLRTRDRAVTADDYEALALLASSSVGRALCLQPRAAGAPNTPPPGIVHLLLVPDVSPREGRMLPDQLQVSSETMQEVQAFLDERRLLTTIVTIGQPEYLWVSVHAQLKARREADLEALERQASAQLYRFINPLTGGADANGWAFGRDLYISEVFAILQSIPGVEYIEQVNLLVEGTAGAQVRVSVPTNGLIASGEHRIVVV